MNLNYNCCNESFQTIPKYLNHLKQHEINFSYHLKCNLCGGNCINWPTFRKHNTKYHKKENPLELFDTFNIMLENLNIEDDLIIHEAEEGNQLNDECIVLQENIEETLNDIENKKINYAQYLLQMTYEHKLTANTVDSLNYHTKNLFVSLINDLKVIIANI